MSHDGVAALSAQVDRAREDAQQAKEHVQRYCSLSLGELGLLPDVFGAGGAHRDAVELVVRALGDLVDRTRYVVEGIEASVQDHHTLEDETSRVFTDLAQALSLTADAQPMTFERFALRFSVPSFSDIEEPTSMLTDPGIEQREPLWKFDLLSPDSFNPPSWVRKTILELTGHDPFEAAVRALSGDWAAFQRVQFVWVSIALFSGRVGQNLAWAAMNLPDAWKGLEASAARRYVYELANATTDLGRLCMRMAGHYGDAVTAAKAFNEAVAGILADITLNAGLMAAAGAAARAPHPAVRWPARAILMLIGLRVTVQINRVKEHIDTLQTALKAVTGALSTLRFTGLDALVVGRSLR